MRPVCGRSGALSLAIPKSAIFGRPSSATDDVGRLDVAVHYALRVSITERFRQFLSDLQGSVQRQCPVLQHFFLRGLGPGVRGRGGLGNGQPRLDDCTHTVRLNFQGPAKLSKPFSHSPNSDSGRASRCHCIQLLWWYAFAFVLHVDKNLTVAVTKANLGCRTS